MAAVVQALIGSSVASGGIALVQSASGTTADGSAGLTVSFGVPVTAGNSVIALISLANDGDVAVDPSLVGGGGGYLESITSEYNASADFFIAVKGSHDVASGVTGVTTTLNIAVRASMQILEFSGLADAAATDTDTASANTATPGVAGLSGNGIAIIISAYANATSAYSSGPSGGYTRIGTGTGGASVYQESYYLIGAAGASTITLSGALDTASAGAAFGGE